MGEDVHKGTINVAAAEPDRAPGGLIGKVSHDVHKVLKVLAKVGTAELQATPARRSSRPCDWCSFPGRRIGEAAACRAFQSSMRTKE